MELPFHKMHGLGNDFVVVDARAAPVRFSPDQARRIADRRRGVGFDQLLVIEPPGAAAADLFLRILNADGSESSACGNGTRCVAALVMDEAGRDALTIETRAGLLPCRRTGDGVAVDMGPAAFGWRDIPLAREADTLHLPLAAGPFADAVGVSMGNPHAVFFVADADGAPIERFGPVLEHDALLPERANIGAAQVLDQGALRLRVWERGVGLTPACGSGACAAAVAAARRGLTGRQVRVHVDGGTLDIDWRDDGHVVMAGRVATSFTGVLDEALLSG
jgi:diaminopimelate epimerase